jgi:hypothetical protein
VEAAEFQQFVLLNRLVSRSATRASEEHKPPLVTGFELLSILNERQKAGGAIEFFGVTDSERDAAEDDNARIKKGEGHDFVWLRKIKINQSGAFRYAKLLFEFVDQSKRSFSVVHTKKLTGREISGANDERGGISAHVVIRLPIKQYDDGSYRCAIEVARHLNRGTIENFINKQLKRWATAAQLKFEVHQPDKKGKMLVKEYRYNPRLELFSDIGRKLTFATAGGRELAHMTFTKRSERPSIGKGTHALHEDVIADVEFRVSAKQGPAEPQARYQWLRDVRASFEFSGYESRMYYRSIGGSILSGSVHQALAGASDLVMCQKELMLLKHAPKDWYPEIDDEITEQMATFLDKDELWERGK